MKNDKSILIPLSDLMLRENEDPKFDVHKFDNCFSRAVPVVNESFNEKDLSVDNIVATELPVLVWDWVKWEPVREVLLMEGAMIPESKQVVSLNNHSRFTISDVIGSTREIHLEKNVRLSKDYTGDVLKGKLFIDSGEEKIIRLIREKHLTDTSIGYRTFDNETVRIPPNETGIVNGQEIKNDYGDGFDLVIRKKWQLFENSLTPVGADKLAKLKSQTAKEKSDDKFFVLDVKDQDGNQIDFDAVVDNEKEKPKLFVTINKQQSNERKKEMEPKENEKEVNELVSKELQRRDGISKACERLQGQTTVDLSELRNEFLADKSKTALDFFNEVNEKHLKKPTEIPDLKVGMDEKEIRDYSIRKVILYSLGVLKDGDVGVELEADKTLRKKLGADMDMDSKNSVLIPEEIMNRRRVLNLRKLVPNELDLLTGKRSVRDLVVGTDASGGYTVQDQYIAQSFIDYLVNAMVFKSAGVQVITGLKGDIPMVRELDDFTYYWAAEGSGITQSNITFGEERVVPNKGGALAKYSYEFLNQTSLAVEAYIERRLAGVCGRGFDAAIGYGTGSGQPKGLKNWTGVGATSGAGFNRKKALSMEASIETANAADLGTMKWLSKPAVRSELKDIKIDAGSGRFLCNDENEMIGYDYSNVSNMFTAGDLMFGVWNQILGMYWDMLQIRANEYDDDAFKAGDVLVRALQFVDVFVLNPAAFNIATDVAP